MADGPTTGELFKAKAITDDDLCAAVDAFMADPTTALFVMGDGCVLNLAEAVQAHEWAKVTTSDPTATDHLKRRGAHGDPAGATGEAMSDTPPWFEVTPDDFHYRRAFGDLEPVRAWVAQEHRVKELLDAQDRGEYRLRLVLREAADLMKRPNPDPCWFFSYDVGASMISLAEEVVIEFRNGRREVVLIARGPGHLPGSGWASGRR
ncbi:hypothetical protein J2X36_000739 [Methylobacterium sp. BE186]|uniref:hypothetical protein n=1 Tax=Methylobacterium sp. BE186 TaxID=2817715 RepID=UPI002866BC9C|nr:hypothetical protein [Methylobacterium sp. BE186]MDR7036003.1 hypothetical protein [Methylobacterium sp. BE186]